jgi:REP element-mobilizing transposase RayT
MSATCRAQARLRLHAYVLMTNHVDLLVTPRQPEAISLVK